ncbi:hypothetical protein BLIC_b00405 [Bifidobacterium longum subsp. infantis]|uniref:Uncharacterized protein n=1 Tax=Bifidobacterium longum subsp. infantis TaxID=1682 RepID=A0ABM9R288_BIFLI|nr:hypothetical protein BLIC_a00402 [Bifidobacterium longum subsp. infantis]CEE97796.1 hypothetical protein BLIC_b00405 [Bifidobacterium longum subsp. infantis]CEE98629.1 hypothetical protein BLIC_c00410 [Bifidobacterium longum subsp. infantis]CEF01875.1 hypothetical protein BLIC_e00409 [Bifidobacterium longum subsp. infantis]CEF04416.1 hypothetical protein BLIC_g00408 [Bifidobacterium longum subsp. infantis]
MSPYRVKSMSGSMMSNWHPSSVSIRLAPINESDSALSMFHSRSGVMTAMSAIVSVSSVYGSRASTWE